MFFFLIFLRSVLNHFFTDLRVHARSDHSHGSNIYQRKAVQKSLKLD